ncbi:MAG: hypothetical protein ABH804_01340 [archaeon]
MKRWMKILGVSFILKGALTIFLFYKGVTGFFIVDKIGAGSSFSGILFILAGCLLFLAGKK